ncbi:MAG TPA: ABC transporter substrate-binding protein [Steroidobacteraceae bacterium]|nr:ABC transporter substrate-binding protein [Steroidobacteraceae bacterium]
MQRREFMTLLCGAAVTWPLPARTQQATALIGFLSGRSPDESTGLVAAFRQGLRETGFVEGQNLAIAFRWAEGHYDRLPALAAELVGLRVAVLYSAGGPAAALAAKAATSVIPIVFSAANDPVGRGLVASLNRPGGNVTGMSLFASDLWAKNVELLKELVPTANVMAYLVNPSSPSVATYLKGAAEAASALGVDIHLLNASTERELDEAFASLARLRVGGLIVPNEPYLDSQRDRIATLAARYAVPALYNLREYVVAGGLASYGPSLPDSYRRAAMYAGRILKGEKPTDLPIQVPTKFEFVINLKAAKAIGITIPPTLLARADEVIE